MVGFSPYRNGTRLVPAMTGSFDAYTLYCSCSQPSTASLWKCSDMKVCRVTKPAHSRGYGSFEEIVPLPKSQGPAPV